MPTIQAHQQQADRNRAFLDEMPEGYPEWVVTALFYSGLHLLEACLAQQGTHSANHAERASNLRRLRSAPSFQQRRLFDKYQDLYELSRQARYDCVQVDPQDLADARASLEDIAQWASWRLS